MAKNNRFKKETNRHEFGEYVHLKELSPRARAWGKKWINRVYRRTMREEKDDG